MKKFLVAGLLIVLCPLMIFASETEEKKITRQHPTAFNVDVGALLYLPLGEEEKGGGVFGAASLTPVLVKKLSAGLRMEGSAYAGKDILDGGSKLKKINLGLTSTVILNYPLARSFEVYAGGGARYIIRQYEKPTKFGQAWGPIIQGGARGRVTNCFGVGVEANMFFNLTDDKDCLDLLAYMSFEF